MSIQAILRDVDLAPDEPFGKRRVPLEDLRPLLDPDQLLRPVGPVSLRIGGGLPEDLGIAEPRVPAERLRRRAFLPFLQEAVNSCTGDHQGQTTPAPPVSRRRSPQSRFSSKVPQES